MYIRPRKRRRSNPWRVLFLLILIAGALYAYTLIQRRQIENPFTPTPTPTRSAYFYREEAEALYIQGDLEGAIQAYEQAVRLAPDDVDLYVPLVRLLVLKGRPDEAVVWGERGVDVAPESAPAWAVLGLAYDWVGRVPDAIEACLRAVELGPAYAEAYAYLAEAYTDDRRVEKGLEAAQKALELAPRSVDAYRAYGYVLEHLGNWSGAIEAYRKGLEVHPYLAHLYLDIGRNYLALADTASALEAFRRAVELDPNRADALDQLGWAYFAIQDYELAQSYLEQAIEVDPNYAPAYGHLATTYWVRRNYESAIPNFEKAIDLAYQAARRKAYGFSITVESAQEPSLYPSPDVVLEGELAWGDERRTRLAATLEPSVYLEGNEETGGRVTLDVLSGRYSLFVHGLPSLPADQVYVGWFQGLEALDGTPFNTGPLPVTADGGVEFEGRAEPVRGPRIEHFYTLGLCYFYMAQCERAYPLFDAALQIDPEEPNALEGIRLCQEAEGTPVPTPTP
ncbi:MAG TPA: tetratricopeptide repeat protein [Thermoflexia bacterium]|nr:tetratricopeptide repeat protein [Thermoflexia bacterium]